jgi:hypothetical protein
VGDLTQPVAPRRGNVPISQDGLSMGGPVASQHAVGATKQAVAAPDVLEEISDEPYDESMWSDAEHEGFGAPDRRAP